MWGDEQGESGRAISIVTAEATWMALEATGSNTANRKCVPSCYVFVLCFGFY